MTAPSFAQTLKVWCRVAALSFGGPAAQISVMHRLLVDEKKWVREDQFLHALNFCMLLPGPEAQQLATYLGWLLGGVRGGLAAGGLFILPGIIVIMGFSVIYLIYGQVGVVAGAFFGLKTAVLAIVAQAVHKLGKKALSNRSQRVIALAAFLALFAFNLPFPVIILAAGLAGLLDKTPPIVCDDNPAAVPLPPLSSTVKTATFWLTLWLGPVAVLWAVLGRGNIFTEIALFFATIAAITFGGAYSILAWVAQEAVQHYHWLTHAQMLDGLGLAETTPGPLIMVLQFIGFMAAAHALDGSPVLSGVLGGLLATWVTFTPCFLWIFTGAPYMERLRAFRPLSAALRAISASVVGVIFNLALWFAIHTLFAQTIPISAFAGRAVVDLPVLSSVNLPALALTLLAFTLIFAFRFGLSVTLGAGVAGGIAFYLGSGVL